MRGYPLGFSGKLGFDPLFGGLFGSISDRFGSISDRPSIVATRFWIDRDQELGSGPRQSSLTVWSTVFATTFNLAPHLSNCRKAVYLAGLRRIKLQHLRHFCRTDRHFSLKILTPVRTGVLHGITGSHRCPELEICDARRYYGHIYRSEWPRARGTSNYRGSRP